MRITGGIKLRRDIKAPSGWNTRPTSDIVREALFNILMHHFFGVAIGDPITGARVLDAFCGSGALALEAMSRGAGSAVMFDTDKKAIASAQDNVKTLGFEHCAVLRADATKPPRADLPAKLIFLDPPYNKNLIPKALVALDDAGWLAKNCVLVLETSKNEIVELPEKYAPIFFRSWGDTSISIMTNGVPELKPPT